MSEQQFSSEYLQAAKIEFERHELFWISQGVDSPTKLLFVKSTRKDIEERVRLRKIISSLDPQKIPTSFKIPREYLEL